MEEWKQDLEKYKNSIQEITNYHENLKRMIDHYRQYPNNRNISYNQLQFINDLYTKCEEYIQTLQKCEQVFSFIKKPFNNEQGMNLLVTYYDLNYKYELLRCMRENLLSAITESNMINQLLFEGNDSGTITNMIRDDYSMYFNEVYCVYNEFEKKKTCFEQEFLNTYSYVFYSNGSFTKYDRVTCSLYLRNVLEDYQYTTYKYLKEQCPPLINTFNGRCIFEAKKQGIEMKKKIQANKRDRIKKGITLRCPKCETMNHKDCKFCMVCKQYLESDRIFIPGKNNKHPKSTNQLYLFVC